MSDTEAKVVKANYEYFEREAGDFNAHFAEKDTSMKDPLRRFVYKNFLKGHGHKRTQLLISMLDQPLEGSHILDLGCGSGHNLLELAKNGATVTGVDYSEAMLRFANETLLHNGFTSEQFMLIKDNVLTYKPSKKVDAITCSGVTEYLSWEDLERLIKNISQIAPKNTVITLPASGTFTLLRTVWLRFSKKVFIFNHPKNHVLALFKQNNLKVLEETSALQGYVIYKLGSAEPNS
jgi:2-polyprenyl-3-methyl-5-hydroxy-6-metoxy-1,4-benzoquinol methylase